MRLKNHGSIVADKVNSGNAVVYVSTLAGFPFALATALQNCLQTLKFFVAFEVDRDATASLDRLAQIYLCAEGEPQLALKLGCVAAGRFGGGAWVALGINDRQRIAIRMTDVFADKILCRPDRERFLLDLIGELTLFVFVAKR